MVVFSVLALGIVAPASTFGARAGALPLQIDDGETNALHVDALDALSLGTVVSTGENGCGDDSTPPGIDSAGAATSVVPPVTRRQDGRRSA